MILQVSKNWAGGGGDRTELTDWRLSQDWGVGMVVPEPSMALAGQFRLKTQTGSKHGQTGHWVLTRHLQALLWLRAGMSPSKKEILGNRIMQAHMLIAAISLRRPH